MEGLLAERVFAGKFEAGRAFGRWGILLANLKLEGVFACAGAPSLSHIFAAGPDYIGLPPLPAGTDRA